MPWGKMDDKFHRNRKVIPLGQTAVGLQALGVWTFWWSWCLDDPELTGFVPLEELRDDERKSAALLVQVGLWDAVDGGFRFHDWRAYEKSNLPRRTVFERDGWRCSYCDTEITMETGHADHVIPRSRGGSDDLSNLVAACAPCNLSKGARTPAEWLS
jgi:hypothetical protein